jgi:hypothetical protein
MNSNTVIVKHLFQEDLYNIPPRVIVVLSKPWEEVSENDRTVLSKMLVAVRLNLSVVQIIHRTELSIDELTALAPSRVLTFGTNLKQSTKRYEFMTLEGIPVIAADSLEQLDDIKKKNLWIALKQMFAL